MVSGPDRVSKLTPHSGRRASCNMDCIWSSSAMAAAVWIHFEVRRVIRKYSQVLGDDGQPRHRDRFLSWEHGVYAVRFSRAGSPNCCARPSRVRPGRLRYTGQCMVLWFSFCLLYYENVHMLCSRRSTPRHLATQQLMPSRYEVVIGRTIQFHGRAESWVLPRYYRRQ